jgi:hypothetical protein
MDISHERTCEAAMLEPVYAAHPDPNPKSPAPTPAHRHWTKGSAVIYRSWLFWGLCLSLLGAATAQTPLAAYTRTKAALTASVAALPEDSVASLDALRRAERTSEPLLETLETPLRQGLQATFDRAEQAIVNASPSDLKVQAAVLFGGLQRSLYEQALDTANEGNPAQASRLLSVLGGDLELRPARFTVPQSDEPAQALQLAFERRLAARGLAQLTFLQGLPQGEQERSARYEALAQLYGHLFPVLDSPRLPVTTQQTVLDAIELLVANASLGPSLRTLRTQLQGFENASRLAQARLEPQTQSPAPTPQQAEPAQAAPANPQTDTAIPAPADEAETSETAVPEATSETPAETASAPAASTSAATPEVQPTSPSTPLGDGGASGGLELLSEPVKDYLLIAAGLLALVGLVSLLVRIDTSPVQNTAIALLLLPILSEGLITLGATLAPLVGVPALAQGEAYSLFSNPLVQTLWVLLALVAGLLLLVARAPSPQAVSSRTGASKIAPPQPASAKDAPKPAVPQTTAPQTVTPRPSSSQPRAPLSAGGFNWDEDF